MMELVTFGAGLLMGGIPSALLYIAAKREVLVDHFLASQPETKHLVDGGELTPIVEKEVNINVLMDAIVRAAEEDGDSWVIYNNTNYKNLHGTYYEGAESTKLGLSVLRNYLTFSHSKDVYINGNIQITQNQFTLLMSRIQEARNKYHTRTLYNKLQKKEEPVKKLSELNKERQVKLLPDLNKEVGSKTIDPFALTYDDHIYAIGKAQACMNSVSQKSEWYKNRLTTEQK